MTSDKLIKGARHLTSDKYIELANRYFIRKRLDFEQPLLYFVMNEEMWK